MQTFCECKFFWGEVQIFIIDSQRSVLFKSLRTTILTISFRKPCSLGVHMTAQVRNLLSTELFAMRSEGASVASKE